MTPRAQKLLELLHGTRAVCDGSSDETQAERKLISEIFRRINELGQVASLDSLARNFFGKPPVSSPGLAELNQVLERVDVSKLSSSAIITILRGPASKKALLPAWERVRDHAYWELRDRKKDVDRLLWGLFEKDWLGRLKAPPRPQ